VKLFLWIVKNALGFGVGFVVFGATMQFTMSGFRWAQIWDWEAPIDQPAGFWIYPGLLIGLLIYGAILGLAQSLALGSLLQRPGAWVGATCVGFALLAVLIWPVLDILKEGIPGPVEPLIYTVGAGALSGFVQFRMVLGGAAGGSRWLKLWILGLVVSVVPTALMFILLEQLGFEPGWQAQVFLSGLMVGGVAAWISGKALFAALAGVDRPEAMAT
jgi:hypothetical protein